MLIDRQWTRAVSILIHSKNETTHFNAPELPGDKREEGTFLCQPSSCLRIAWIEESNQVRLSDNPKCIGKFFSISSFETRLQKILPFDSSEPMGTGHCWGTTSICTLMTTTTDLSLPVQFVREGFRFLSSRTCDMMTLKDPIGELVCSHSLMRR